MVVMFGGLVIYMFYNPPVSPGSVLSVCTKVESVLTNDGQKKGQHAKMQVFCTYTM